MNSSLICIMPKLGSHESDLDSTFKSQGCEDSSSTKGLHKYFPCDGSFSLTPTLLYLLSSLSESLYGSFQLVDINLPPEYTINSVI